MKLEMKTMTLKEMVKRVAKGVGNVKQASSNGIAITSLLGIKYENGSLTLMSTDAANYIYVSETDVKGDELYAVVPASIFINLIERMTCEMIKMSVVKGKLKISGNGDYVIPFYLDVDGSEVKFPDPIAEGLPKDWMKKRKSYKVKTAVLKTILSSLQPSILKVEKGNNFASPIANYYMGECALTTNEYQMATMPVSIFGNEECLISPTMMQLAAATMTYEEIEIYRLNDVIIWQTPDCVIYGNIVQGVELYPVSALLDATKNTKFKSTCTVSKTAFLNVLSRLKIFINKEDKGALDFRFTKDGLQITTKADSGTEVLPYKKSNKHKDCDGEISYSILYERVRTFISDEIEISYGADGYIKLVDGDVTHLVALGIFDDTTEDEMEELEDE